MKNKRLEEFKEKIKGKKIAVLGLGVSNIPAIEYLHKLGAYIYAHDLKDSLGKNCEQIKDLDNIEFFLDHKCFSGLNDVDYIVRSPGVKPFTKEIEEAVKKGVLLTSEMELFMEFCPCKVIGITGSAGKTTVTTLVTEFLKAGGYNVWQGGNIGTPLFSKIEEIQKDDIVVLELSSFQLMTMKKSPNISLITNIYEDHLDYHRSFEEYINAKTNIFTHQQKRDVCIFNFESAYTQKFLKMREKLNIESEILYFSGVNENIKGAYLKGKDIYLNETGNESKKVISVDEVKLKGNKNYINICSAICLVHDLVSLECITDTLKKFKGVEHRLEYVDTKNGVEYYNDSISTTPGKAMAALTSFDQKIILIAGGYDKNLDYTNFGNYVIDSCKYVILIGDTTKKIKDAILNNKRYEKENIKIKEAVSLEDAIKHASSISEDGDIVVMSPASASFDMFKSYKQRGKIFKELVEKL